MEIHLFLHFILTHNVMSYIKHQINAPPLEDQSSNIRSATKPLWLRAHESVSTSEKDLSPSKINSSSYDCERTAERWRHGDGQCPTLATAQTGGAGDAASGTSLTLGPPEKKCVTNYQLGPMDALCFFDKLRSNYEWKWREMNRIR